MACVGTIVAPTLKPGNIPYDLVQYNSILPVNPPVIVPAPSGQAVSDASIWPLIPQCICSLTVDRTSTVTSAPIAPVPYITSNPYCLTPTPIPNLWAESVVRKDIASIWEYVLHNYPAGAGEIRASKLWCETQSGALLYRSAGTLPERFALGSRLAYPWYNVQIANCYNDVWTNKTGGAQGMRQFIVNLYGGSQSLGFSRFTRGFGSTASTGWTQIGYNPHMYPGSILIFIAQGPVDPPGSDMTTSWGNVMPYDSGNRAKPYVEILPIRVAFAAIPEFITGTGPSAMYTNVFGFNNLTDGGAIFGTLNRIYQEYMSLRDRFTFFCLTVELQSVNRVRRMDASQSAAVGDYYLVQWNPGTLYTEGAVLIGLNLDELRVYATSQAGTTVMGQVRVFTNEIQPGPYSKATTGTLNSGNLIEVKDFLDHMKAPGPSTRCSSYSVSACASSRNAAGTTCIVVDGMCTESTTPPIPSAKTHCSDYTVAQCVNVKNATGVACEVVAAVCTEVIPPLKVWGLVWYWWILIVVGVIILICIIAAASHKKPAKHNAPRR